MNDRIAKRDAAMVLVEVLPFDAPAGHTVFSRDVAGKVLGMQFGCPCGCGAHYGARFFGTDQSSGWTIEGPAEKPTVTPSLGCYPTGGKRAKAVGPDGVYHWHGYLKAGVFEEC